MSCLPIARAIAIALIVAVAAPRATAEGVGVIAAGAGQGDRATLAAALADAIGAVGAVGPSGAIGAAGSGAAPGRRRVVADALGEARSALAAGAVPARQLAAFRRVREMIDEGWRAFLRVQIDFAQNRLAAARREAEALAALPGGTELYADAALRLGAVMQYRRVPEAAAVLAQALALDPDRPITLAEFSPDVVDAVAAVRAAPRITQRVHIATEPAGAIVSVDGHQLGAAPLDADVAQGQHLVIARAPLHRAAVRGVGVGVAIDGPARVDLSLESDPEAVRLSGGALAGLAAPAEQALVDAALELADLDEVVVATVRDRRGGAALIAQRCAGIPARCTPVVEIGFADRTALGPAAREAWRAVQGGALREPPRVLGEPGEIERRTAPAGCRLCRNPLVWAGVGAAVLGAAIAILVTSGSQPPPVVTVDGRDFGR